MTVCVDSNIALKWVLPEDRSGEAVALLARWRAAWEEIVAPAYFYVEVASVLRQRTTRIGSHRISLDKAPKVSGALPRAGITIRNALGLHDRALDLAAELARPTTYDTCYRR